MAQQIINFGTGPSGADGDTSRIAFDKLQSNDTDLYAAAASLGISVAALASQISAGYIDGFKLQYVGAKALTVSGGAAYIPASNAIISAANPIAKAGLVLTASTWYHVYLFMNGANADVEVVTTAPAPAYRGTARAKTGDTSRRYVGSVLTDASGNIFNFDHNPLIGKILYLANISPTPFAVMNGNASTPTNVSCSTVVPVTSRLASIAINNNDASVTLLLGNSVFPPQVSPITFLESVSAQRSLSTELDLDANQAFQYTFLSAPSANAVARVKGYFFER